MTGSGYDSFINHEIINLPHHVSTVHAPMPMADRAAQFSPFSALAGYEEAIEETGRLTEGKVYLAKDARELLDEKLRMLQGRTGERFQVSITFFQPDQRKEGGKYTTVTGFVKRIDEYERVVVMEDGRRIAVDEILEIREEA